MSKDKFEVLPAREMREKYGLYAENRPKVTLNASNVPAALHSLVPLAEQFGVSDDLMRADMLSKCTADSLQSMRSAVHDHEDALTEWLAGPEASGPTYSAEYIAFSALLMAADGC